MKKLIQLLALSIILFYGVISAHVYHDEEPLTINEQQALNAASYQLERLVKLGQVDQSWQSVESTSAVYTRRESRYGWKISFTDPNQEKDKKILFVFLSKTGNFLSTNFTGK